MAVFWHSAICLRADIKTNSKLIQPLDVEYHLIYHKHIIKVIIRTVKSRESQLITTKNLKL